MKEGLTWKMAETELCIIQFLLHLGLWRTTGSASCLLLICLRYTCRHEQETCFPYYIRFPVYSLIPSLYFGSVTPVKCLNPTLRLCVNLQNQNTPLALQGKKKTHTHSPSLHKRMASRFFPKSLKLSSDSAPEKRGDPTHTDMNSCTCLPARAVATSSVSSYSTKNCIQSAKKRDRTSHCRAPPRLPARIRDAGRTHRHCRGVWRCRPSCSTAVPALFLDSATISAPQQSPLLWSLLPAGSAAAASAAAWPLGAAPP